MPDSCEQAWALVATNWLRITYNMRPRLADHGIGNFHPRRVMLDLSHNVKGRTHIWLGDWLPGCVREWVFICSGRSGQSYYRLSLPYVGRFAEGGGGTKIKIYCYLFAIIQAALFTATLCVYRFQLNEAKLCIEFLGGWMQQCGFCPTAPTYR